MITEGVKYTLSFIVIGLGYLWVYGVIMYMRREAKKINEFQDKYLL